jgi:hypothetical protein
MSDPNEYNAYLRSIGGDKGPLCPFCKVRPCDYSGQRSAGPPVLDATGQKTYPMVNVYRGHCADPQCSRAWHEPLEQAEAEAQRRMDYLWSMGYESEEQYQRANCVSGDDE